MLIGSWLGGRCLWGMTTDRLVPNMDNARSAGPFPSCVAAGAVAVVAVVVFAFVCCCLMFLFPVVFCLSSRCVRSLLVPMPCTLTITVGVWEHRQGCTMG